MEYNETLRKVIDFHGHMCPGVAYGYRVAAAALDRLGKRAEDEEIVAIVENDSCAVDAVQVMTGCTFGKGNLIYKEYGKQVYTFFSRTRGKGFRISVLYKGEESPEEKAAWERIRSGDKSPESAQIVRALKERKIKAILSAEENEVLSVASVSFPPPPKASIYSSVRCKKCGEKTMELRTIEREGKRLCIPCSEE